VAASRISVASSTSRHAPDSASSTFSHFRAGGLLDQALPYARDFTHGRLLNIGARLAKLAAEWHLDSVYELALRFALA